MAEQDSRELELWLDSTMLESFGVEIIRVRHTEQGAVVNVRSFTPDKDVGIDHPLSGIEMINTVLSSIRIHKKGRIDLTRRDGISYEEEKKDDS